MLHYIYINFLYLHNHWIQEENIALDNLKLLYNYFNFNENCETNKKVEETSFVSHIIYASVIC